MLEDPTSTFQSVAFDALVGIVARNAGTELVGDDRSLAEETFARSLIGSSFPSFWLEVPLAGEAGFDLHVL